MASVVILHGGEQQWAEELSTMPHVEAADALRFMVNDDGTVTLRLDLPDNTIVTTRVTRDELANVLRTLFE